MSEPDNDDYQGLMAVFASTAEMAKEEERTEVAERLSHHHFLHIADDEIPFNLPPSPPPLVPPSANVNEALSIIDMHLFSDFHNPPPPPPFMINAANYFATDVENLFTLPSPSPPRSPPLEEEEEEELDIDKLFVNLPLPPEAFPEEAVEYFGIEVHTYFDLPTQFLDQVENVVDPEAD
ncbi:hypothetical protein TSUD_258190 [Trifolium subterraneum]|uniref:Uncharacterized protein n=1 Tax=Trifolium subterraneum TaxID=3900 RepID=A0A2Z6N886_TRISU|nr:hypothetical protein TSUD_258190 [Trifolium subterraneum]